MKKNIKRGGLLEFGIPDFRLDKKLVQNVIMKLKQAGVEIKNNIEFGKDISIEKLKAEGYSAIFLAIGAEKALTYNLGCEENKNIITSNEVLHSYNTGKYLSLGTVAVIGGGNVAMDTARVAIRMNANKVYIVYRRNRELMPARDIEVKETLKDGVEIIYNTKVIKAYEENENIRKIGCVKTKIENNKVIEIENSEHEINVDTVVFAIGLKPNIGFNIEQEQGLIRVDESGKTNIEGVFAGGDAVQTKATVCRAINSGKVAAHGIDQYLQS